MSERIELCHGLIDLGEQGASFRRRAQELRDDDPVPLAKLCRRVPKDTFLA